MAKITLAVDRPFSNSQTREREADFIPIVCWRQLAETCSNYLRKGRLAAVEGRMQIRNYENNEGRKVYVTEVVADNVRFLESQNSGSNNGGNTNAQSVNNYGSGGHSGGHSDPFEDDGKPLDISDDSLPF